MKTFIFTTLAEYQTVFWVKIAKHLLANGHQVYVISFDTKSSILLQHEGINFLSIPKYELSDNITQTDLNNLYDELNIKNVSLYLSHEKYALNRTNFKKIQQRFFVYFKKINCFIKQINQNNNIIMVQELGGFVSNLAAWKACEHEGIDNYFIEPSFFKGYQFVLKNSIDAVEKFASLTNKESLRISNSYLKRTLSTKSLIIPKKDKHHYTSIYRKILNLKNFKKLITKSIDFYIKKHQFEFLSPHEYLFIHFKMLINSIRLKPNYCKSLQGLGKFYYFPLHVPGDVALTIRSPLYVNQFYVIDYIAKNLPPDVKLIIKEHPAKIGSYSYHEISSLLHNHKNVLLLDPKINNFDILAFADKVITINSKTGAEAILFKKPVAVLGNSFYSSSKFVTRVNKLDNIHKFLFNNATHDFNDKEVQQFFASILQVSIYGELYDLSDHNCKLFSENLVSFIK